MCVLLGAGPPPDNTFKLLHSARYAGKRCVLGHAQPSHVGAARASARTRACEIGLRISNISYSGTAHAQKAPQALDHRSNIGCVYPAQTPRPIRGTSARTVHANGSCEICHGAASSIRTCGSAAPAAFVQLPHLFKAHARAPNPSNPEARRNYRLGTTPIISRARNTWRKCKSSTSTARR